MTTNAEALFELYDRITQKRKQKRKPTVLCNCKHCKYEIGCFRGCGLAEKHREECTDYSSIFKLIHKNLSPPKGQKANIEILKIKMPRRQVRMAGLKLIDCE